MLMMLVFGCNYGLPVQDKPSDSDITIDSADSADSSDSSDSSDSVDTADTTDTSDSNAEPVDNDGDSYLEGEDCDDDDADTYPGAEEIDCRDGVLNDCDASPEEMWDECGPRGSVSIDGVGRVTTIHGAISGDNAGLSVAALGNGLLAISAPNSALYGGTTAKRGSVYIIKDPGTAELFLGDSASYIARISEEGSGADELGWRVARAYDVNGDGYNELMISSRLYGSDAGGTVYLISGAVTGDLDLSDAATLATSPYVFSVVRSERLDDSFGGGLAFIELKEDELDPIAGSQYAFVIGAPTQPNLSTEAGTGGTNSGAVYLIQVPAVVQHPEVSTGPTVVDLATDGWYAKWLGRGTPVYLGDSLAAGDVNGDGVEDLVMGTTGHFMGGAGHLIVGPYDAARLKDDLSAGVMIYGVCQDCGEKIGSPVAIIDGEGSTSSGYPILAFGDPANQAGIVHLVEADEMSGLDPSESIPIASYTFATLAGVSSGERFGSGVADIGDYNGDGASDLVISASYEGRDGQDASYLFLGPFSGGMEPYAIISTDADSSGMSSEVVATVGGTVAPAGDMDGDGFDDFVIGAWGEDFGAGTAYLLHGAPY